MATTKKKAAPKTTKKATPSTKAAKSSISKKTATTTKKDVTNNFWSIQFNVATLAWLIIGVIVVLIALWTYNISQQISDIYDSIDETQLQSELDESALRSRRD